MEDGSHMPLWGFLILFLLLWLNGIFYGFAAAAQNLNEADVEKKALGGDKKSVRLLKLLNKPFQYVNVIPLIVTAAGMWFGLIIVPWATNVLGDYILYLPALVLVMALGAILFASLGILTFRRIGGFQPEKYAYRYLSIVSAVVTVLYPVTIVITWIAKLAACLFGISMEQSEDAMTEEEIIYMVGEAHEQGVIEENEAEMIQNIISFNETNAHDVMTHRKNVIAFDQEVLLQEMVDIMLEEGISRYPVYADSLDNIVGIVNYKDALKFLTKNSWARFKPLKELPGLIRTASLIPETRGIGDLFHSMQGKKLHMAIVVDEYGQTSGIVTMEDILEEIVGDIQDEYDDDEMTIRTQVDNSVVIDGLASLEDVEEELALDFGDVEFETLNGYLTSLLGHVPTEKDLDREIAANGYRFRIVSLGNKTIGRVRAEKIKNEP